MQALLKKETRPMAQARGELRALKERYLSWMLATRYAETTIQGAHADLEWFLRYLELKEIRRIPDVTAQVLNDYSLWLRENKNRRNEGKSLSLHHIQHRLIGVKQFFKWLSKEMIILYDPAQDLEIPKIAHGLPQTILTQKEAQRLMEAPDTTTTVGLRDKALLELLYSTGLRSLELFKLKAQDVDLKGKTLLIRQGKGSKDRLIPLPTIAAACLREYMQKVRPSFAARFKKPEDNTLFVSWTGSPLDQTRLGEMFKRNLKRAAIDKRVTAMTLRHSIASHLLENGMDIRYIQEFLGHEKLSTTQIYAKVTLKGLKKMYNKHHPKERRVKVL